MIQIYSRNWGMLWFSCLSFKLKFQLDFNCVNSEFWDSYVGWIRVSIAEWWFTLFGEEILFLFQVVSCHSVWRPRYITRCLGNYYDVRDHEKVPNVASNRVLLPKCQLQFQFIPSLITTKLHCRPFQNFELFFNHAKY